MKFCYHDPNSLPFLIQGILSLVHDISPTHFARGGGGVTQGVVEDSNCLAHWISFPLMRLKDWSLGGQVSETESSLPIAKSCLSSLPDPQTCLQFELNFFHDRARSTSGWFFTFFMFSAAKSERQSQVHKLLWIDWMLSTNQIFHGESDV